MKIQGHSGGTTISGGGGVEIVLTKVGAAGAADTVGVTRVRLADLTITGAVAATGATPATSATGAGVTVRDDYDTAYWYSVTLENLLVKGNAAEGVRFVRVFESSRPGLVRVRDSVIEGNRKGGVSISSVPSTLPEVSTSSTVSRSADSRRGLGRRPSPRIGFSMHKLRHRRIQSIRKPDLARWGTGSRVSGCRR